MTALAVYWISLFCGTHIPRLPLPSHFNLIDKVCHFAAFAVLALLATLACATRRRDAGVLDWRTLRNLLLVIAAYGAFDEMTQPLVGRSRELLDWLADVMGALVGTAIFAGLWSVARRTERAARLLENVPA